MSEEKDWDNIPPEELKNVAPALLYLKRSFGTSVGNPRNSAPAADKSADKQNSGK